MKITVLSDNIGCGDLQGEWGLSFHIEFNGKTAGLGFLSKYIGLPKGILSTYKDRIKMPFGIAEIDKDVFIVPHSTDGLSKLGRRNHLYVRHGWRYYPDDFSHEQSLVFRTHDGLVVFNSCSHSGADVVMEEVRKAFPEESVKAYLGGLHLFRMNESEVGEIADKIRKAGFNRVITGHCTGDKAYAILRSQLGETIEQFHCGMIIEL